MMSGFYKNTDMMQLIVVLILGVIATSTIFEFFAYIASFAIIKMWLVMIKSGSRFNVRKDHQEDQS